MAKDRTTAPQPQRAMEYGLRDLLRALFKRRLMIVSFFLATALAAMVAVLLIPPTFETTASILVRKGRADDPTSPKETTQLVSYQVEVEDLNSEIELLKSRQLIEAVLEDLGVDESWRKPKSFDPRGTLKRLLGSAQLSYFEEMVLHLQKRVHAVPIPKSNIIKVSYRSKDPEQATMIVRRLTELYLDYRTEVMQSPQTASFFEEQTTAAEDRLTSAEDALQNYMERAGIMMLEVSENADPLAAQKEQVLGMLGELETELAAAHSAIRGRQTEVQVLSSRLGSEPERLQSADRLKQDPAVEEIEKGLIVLQLRRDELIQVFSAKSWQVRDVNAQIELAQERLSEAVQRSGTINRTEVNPVHQGLASDFYRAQSELEGYRSKEKILKSQIESARRNLADLNQKGFEFERLHREVSTARESYLLYRKKHEEARISRAMEQEKIVNVSLAQPARKPLEPAGLGKTMTLALAVIFGLAGALAVGIGSAHFDHTLSTGSAVELHLGAQVLGSIPEDDSAARAS